MPSIYEQILSRLNSLEKKVTQAVCCGTGLSGYSGYSGGGGGGSATAVNGVSILSSNVVLGNNVGGNLATLTSNREIPFAGFSVADSGAQGMFHILQPDNYGTSYILGNPNPQTANRFYDGYARFDGVNPDSRPNIVRISGYNTTVGGGRVVTTDAGFGYRDETHFIINGLANTVAHMEFHQPEFYAYDGNAYRLWSIYAHKSDGDAFIQSCNSSVVFYDRSNAGDPSFPHFGVTKTNGGGSVTLSSYNPTDVPAFTLSNTTHGNVLIKFDTGVFYIQAPVTKDWAIQGRDTTAAFRRWDWTTTQVGGTGWSMVFGQSPVFAGTESVVQIYSTGNTSSTQTFQTRRTGIVGRSFTIWDDGSVIACGSNTNGDGQFSIGVVGNPGNIAASAKLQVDSTTLGFLPPRMTTTQRNAIVSPAEGLMVYDTTLHHPFYHNGTVWTQI